MSNKPKIYLAGPDVFRPDAIAYGKYLKEVCDKYGAEGLYPLDNEIKPVTSRDGVDPKFHTGMEIFKANCELIRSCDAVVANITPFRGPSADVGTVWEMGFASGISKVVVAYTKQGLPYKERVVDKMPHDGMSVEDFGMYDNLMVIGGTLSVSYDINSAVKAAIGFLEKK